MMSAPGYRPGHIVTAGMVLALATGVPAAGAATPEITLSCAYAETVTGTSGKIQHRERRDVVRLGDHLYQSWDGPTGGWGENLCATGQCDISAGVFELQASYAERQDGYELQHQERRTLNLNTGQAMSQTRDGTVQVVTGFEVETTIYDEGSCQRTTPPDSPGSR